MKRALFVILALAALTPSGSAPVALVTGIVFALTLGNPFSGETKRFTAPLLQLAVMGLGAGMNLRVIARVGAVGIGYTALGIVLTLALGTLLARALRADSDTALLISVGTAICGGSAIAAVAPVIRARSHQTSVALAVVFLLNAVALIVFPIVGHALGLGAPAFGLWSALAIHDTSSVVGAASQFGPDALEVATTVKLARALWIVPVTLVIARHRAARTGGGTHAALKRPWFILGFVLMAGLITWQPALHEIGQAIAECARHLLVLTLFLIGSAISRDALRSVGARPLVHGVALWIAVATVSLGSILAGWIHL